MPDRRSFLRLCLGGALAVGCGALRHPKRPRLAVTMDDPHTRPFPLMESSQASERILAALARHKHQIALFVSGRNIDSPAGEALLSRFTAAGHLICNHSWSHLNFHDARVELETYAADMLRCHEHIRSFPTFTPLFRYPMLREGDTADKRDGMRVHLHTHGYRNGAATIDTSDWYIEVLLNRKLAANPRLNLSPARDYYIAHMLRQAVLYRAVARALTGREPAHTLLVHFNQLNALFLGDLLDAFHSTGWDLLPAADAFADSVFSEQPNVMPAGNSLIKALARQAGLSGEILDPPGEQEDLIEREFSSCYRGGV